jgi:hypothetical protein
MATAPRPFIATAPSTRVARVANVTLFALAAQFYDDPLQWVVIAQANSLIDPWVLGYAELVIPDLPLKATSPTGILGL